MSIKMNDESIMPFGDYKGQKLANIPASYFLWLDKQVWCSREMKEYIKENMDSFEFELKNEKID